MPAETWAARASARCRSSSVNGFCQSVRSSGARRATCAECAAARTAPSHRPVGDALGRSQLRIVIDAAHRIRLAPGEAPLGHLLDEVETARLTFSQPVGQRPDLQLVARGPRPAQSLRVWASSTCTASWRIESSSSSSLSMLFKWRPARRRSFNCSPAGSEAVSSWGCDRDGESGSFIIGDAWEVFGGPCEFAQPFDINSKPVAINFGGTDGPVVPMPFRFSRGCVVTGLFRADGERGRGAAFFSSGVDYRWPPRRS